KTLLSQEVPFAHQLHPGSLAWKERSHRILLAGRSSRIVLYRMLLVPDVAYVRRCVRSLSVDARAGDDNGNREKRFLGEPAQHTNRSPSDIGRHCFAAHSLK